jgi:hypothetical protein
MISFKDHVDVCVEEMLELRSKALEWTEGKGYCTYVETGAFNSFSKEVKEALVTKEHSSKRIAIAVLQSNLAIKIIADLYLKVNKPEDPTKLFRSKEEALKWLRARIIEHNLSSSEGSKSITA